MPKINSQDYHDYVIKAGKFIGEFEQMYQNIDDPWGTVAQVGSLKNDLLLAVIAHIRSRGSVQKVLHAGCAQGALTARVQEVMGDGAQLWGCDISESAIRKASARHRGIEFFTHDLSQTDRIGHPPSSFDLILVAEAMWYILPWLDKIFANFRLLLRPGGHLVVQQYFLQPGQQTYGNDIVQGPEDLCRIVESAGFEKMNTLLLNPSSDASFCGWWVSQEA